MTKKSTDNKIVRIRTLQGVVVSDKSDKTVIVKVQRLKTHPKYGKQYRVDRRYKVHDAKNEYQVGDKVAIRACRPLSKDKKWRAMKKLNV